MYLTIDARRVRPVVLVLLLLAGAVATLWSEARPERPAALQAPPDSTLPVSGSGLHPVYRGPQERPWVALAINVDWGEEVLPEMLATLGRHGVRATFFLTGRWARKFPELARRIAEEGHEIGNHGIDHLHPTRLSDAELRRLVEENAALLEELTGRRPTLFAPPYGEVDERIVRLAAASGHHTVMWTVDTLDWQRPPPSVILDRVARRVDRGAIILMHPTEPTAQALADLLALLQSRRLTPVTVGELVAALEDMEPARSRGVVPGDGELSGSAR